jgi:hypothetical protein
MCVRIRVQVASNHILGELQVVLRRYGNCPKSL